MGKSKIAKAGPYPPVMQATWRTVTSGRRSIDKIVKTQPRKKAWIEIADNNQSPTRAGSSTLEHASFFPDEAAEGAYPSMEDQPLRSCRLPRNQVGITHSLFNAYLN